MLAGIFFTSGAFKNRAARRAEAAAAAKIVISEETLASSPIYTKLQQLGVPNADIVSIVAKLDAIMYTRKLRAQDKYLISLNENDGSFKMLVVTRDLSHYYVVKLNNEYIAGIMDHEIKTTVKSARGSIESSLYASMTAAGMNVPLIIDFTDVFSWNIDFNTETRSGDEYALVWEEGAAASGAVVDNTILAAKYSGAFNGANYAYYFDGDYYDDNGTMSQRLFLKSPISFKNVRITSRFTNSRMHPILRKRRPHLGIDYAAPAGTPIETIADGTVRFAGWKNGFGNYVEVSHANGYITAYGHMKSINVKVGQKIKQGAVVGTVGSTGVSTGPHLDFRVKENGKFVDFLKIKNRSSANKEIPKDKLDEFKKIRDNYKNIMDGVPQ